jgi:hypothetical protein
MRRLWRDNRKLELGLGSSISICRRSNRGTRMTSGSPKCGLGYRAIFPVRRAGRFECIDCRTEVHSWSGVYDYIGWKAIVMQPAVMGREI